LPELPRLRSRQNRLRRIRGTLHQHAHGVGKLRTVLAPVVDALLRDAQPFFVGGGHRIVEADTLDEASIAATARVGDDHVVEGPLLGAAAG
jgi:hypothetical protein